MESNWRWNVFEYGWTRSQVRLIGTLRTPFQRPVVPGEHYSWVVAVCRTERFGLRYFCYLLSEYADDPGPDGYQLSAEFRDLKPFPQATVLEVLPDV